MPDIFLWLISANRRVAYRRFKPYELMYSENRQERGVHCGKVQSFFLKVRVFAQKMLFLAAGCRSISCLKPSWFFIGASNRWVLAVSLRIQLIDFLSSPCQHAKLSQINLFFAGPRRRRRKKWWRWIRNLGSRDCLLLVGTRFRKERLFSWFAKSWHTVESNENREWSGIRAAPIHAL